MERETYPSKGLKKVIESTVVKIISTIIPKANPDFEHLLHKVDYWEIEYNKKENTTWREIGFDKFGNPIAIMPFGDNYGFWTDNQLTLDDYQDFEPITITADEFEKNCTAFEKSNR